ncbi:uncharacterized protein LOC131538300 [Onychostoma macrolepis]|uniref:Ig-like domain-containing protein n=1 Tax=Onychostoma macrolepis TaxID=369639 RepID=A0A7J6DFQ0_9TELE|nr:uncharacterized protein LOC131538300 [Onychostoma macrolepis]KAF4118110.1 hypothetical protein G5714_000161 [Onychostoma macrolepis]
MKIIWTFTLLMIPGVLSSISVTGYSGGGVSITCRYDRKYTDKVKYFCKGEWSTCSDLIKTDIKNKWVYSVRFSLYDDTTAAVFTVIFRDLREQDSGRYYCAVERSGQDPYIEVKLKVFTGQKISAVTGYLGGNIIIKYRYEMKHKNHEKYICKTGEHQCLTLINTNRAAEWTHDRFSVHDDIAARLLHVFIRELNVNDSGEYKIIVKVSKDYSFFFIFHLNIRDADCCEKSISLSAAAGASVNISCKYPQSHSADVKFVCRRSGSDLCAEETSVEESRRWSAEGQIQLYDDREQQLLTGTISHVTRQHSAEYWCGVQSDQGHKSFITRVLVSVTDVPKTTSSIPPLLSTASVFKTSTSNFTSESPNILEGSSLIIPLVLVLVLLVLIIIGLILLFLYKKHQSRGSDSSSQTGAGKHEPVSHTDCDYDEIKVTHRQVPTNPSDSYVYATVQEATGDPQILITSAEDLNYAVVNFRKKADCPDRDRLRNNQDYSEYAAVNHLSA